jgi:general secretion pathway protein K
LKSRSGAHKGMALIAVLWLTAAMGLIVAGVVHEVKTEARSTGLQRDILRGSTQADAAFLLVLQEMQAQPSPLTAGIRQASVGFEQQTFLVQVTPLDGLIDINRASERLLTGLFQHVGQLSPQDAATLAKATIESRQTKNDKGGAWDFQSTEDLMRVPGMTYATYAKIKKLVTAELRSGSGLVNPLAASPATLLLLLDGDSSRASAYFAQRQASPGTPDTSFFNPELIQMAPTESFSLQTKIMLINGDVLNKSLSVQWATDPRTGLPWRILSSQQFLEPASGGLQAP